MKTDRKEKLKSVGLAILTLLFAVIGCVFAGGILLGITYLFEYHSYIAFTISVICSIIILLYIFSKLFYEDVNEKKKSRKDVKMVVAEKEIRAKAIDEFLHNAETKICDRILQNQARLDFASGLSVANRILDEVAEEMKAKDENRRVIKEVYKKVEQIQKILVDEFPEVPKDRIELIAHRLYEQMDEDEDI